MPTNIYKSTSTKLLLPCIGLFCLSDTAVAGSQQPLSERLTSQKAILVAASGNSSTNSSPTLSAYDLLYQVGLISCNSRIYAESPKTFPSAPGAPLPLGGLNDKSFTRHDLSLPENVVLLFQLPYCPELNPLERLWEHLKADLKWATFKTLDQLQSKVDKLLADLTPETIASITGYAFILDALSALNTF